MSVYMGKFDLQQMIIHRLILQSPFISDLGLFYGKMGIALCFFEYGRHKHSCIYTDVGEELLDDIVNQVNTQLSFCFDSGLSGIAWGITYLLQNHFLNGNINEIFEEIDSKIMQISLLRLDDLELDTGLEGLYYYISARIQGSVAYNGSIPFDLHYLKDLSTINPYFEMNNLKVFCSQYPLSLKNIISEINTDEITYLSLPLGLKDGIAGYLLNNII